MSTDSSSPSDLHVRRIELRGHIIDSGTFSHVLGLLTDAREDVAYVIEEIDPGATVEEQSYARLRLEASDADALTAVLDRLRDAGADVVEDEDARLEPAPADGVLPDAFYATTNYETEVRIGGRWHGVAVPEMDCAIVVDARGARTVAGYDVHRGDPIVVGHGGVRVRLPQRARRKAVFEFMASTVSSEKPRHAIVSEVARELLAVRRAGRDVLLVGGPAIVHTGAADQLAALIREGWVTALYAGNALAVHDMEAQFFGTSLGIDLQDAYPVEEGHVHHLRTVNRIRAAGGIRQAIEAGLLRGGVMYEAFSKGIPVVLCGSIRDDGPLPDVITDIVDAQRAMRRYVPQIGMALMVCTLLHSIAVGNLLPATTKTICVDINPASVTKLADRGSHQSLGIVMDASSFLSELLTAVRSVANEAPARV
jgi:lysine-ketoglutarate reductase/saccharopine dehydrogenase-like protein (TIGR00300 family)